MGPTRTREESEGSRGNQPLPCRWAWLVAPGDASLLSQVHFSSKLYSPCLALQSERGDGHADVLSRKLSRWWRIIKHGGGRSLSACSFLP